MKVQTILAYQQQYSTVLYGTLWYSAKLCSTVHSIRSWKGNIDIQKIQKYLRLDLA